MDYNDVKIQRSGERQRDLVTVVYYTDPLCCWSWAFEPHWQRFLSEFSGSISYRYCMAGLIPDWEKYNDPLNSVSRPAQMGPVWMETRHLTGTEINDSIWIKDPPASSYPACIAVKSALMQSAEAQELYLSALRMAVMLHAQNIAKTDVLYEVAVETAAKFPETFSFDYFKADFNSEVSRQLFREDLYKIRQDRIGRFPSVTFTRPGGKGVIITGYRPYEVLVEAFMQVVPDGYLQQTG